jgi:transposase
MGRNGLGLLTQHLSLVPHCFQNKPLARLIAPGMQASHRNEDTLGRALDTLYEAGLTALYRLIAATAATRLGLTPPFAPLDTTRCHVDGRYHSEAAPDEQVVHIPHGYRRAHRPDLNQVLLAWIVEHQAGLPLRLQPLRGKRRDGTVCGQVSRDHMAQVQTAYSPTSLVADRALSNAEHLHKLANPSLTWSTRVPAPLTAAQEVFAQAQPATMAALPDG